MKEYTLNGIKYGTEPDFWKWFYEDEYKNMFFMFSAFDMSSSLVSIAGWYEISTPKVTNS